LPPPLEVPTGADMGAVELITSLERGVYKFGLDWAPSIWGDDGEL